MKKYLLILVFLPLGLFSQNIPFVSGAKSEALGGVTMVVSDVWAVNNNQAVVAFLDAPQVGLYYSNRFMLKALSSQSLAFAMPTKLGSWGVSVERFGNTNYAEMQLGLAYAKALNPYISLGAKFDYLYIRQPEMYGNAGAVLVEVGLFAKPYPDLCLSAHIYNPTLSKLNTVHKQKLPAILSLSAGYNIDKRVMLLAQVDKSNLSDASYKIGVEMNIKERLYLRAGARLHPNAYTLGVAYDFRNIRFNLAFSYQQVLGLTPAGSVEYIFKKVRP